MNVRLRFLLPVFVAFIALADVVALTFVENYPADPDSADAEQYISAAYHLVQHGVLTEAATTDFAPPSVGREPGYAIFLAALMHLDPKFGSFTPACFDSNPACNSLYRVPQWANAVLVSLAGVFTFITARWLFGCLFATWISGAHIWLNHELHDGIFYIVSDYLALFLVATICLTMVWAFRVNRPLVWIVPALFLSYLTLTKAIFFYLFPIIILIIVGFIIFRRSENRQLISILLIVIISYSLPVGAWMARNHALDGEFAITTTRGGIALSTREIFNQMTATQYVTSFVYWTRGFGDGLAKRIFPEAAWKPFEIYEPKGFYLRGQLGYSERVTALQKSAKISSAEARRYIDNELVSSILSAIPMHAATTLPLFYRGIWIDEFIIISFPGLIWLVVYSIRRRRWLVLLVLAPGLFSLIFYPLFSLNIPRYQITAVPTMALALGFLSMQIVNTLRRRRNRDNKLNQQLK